METKRKTKKEILIHIKTKVKFTPSNKKLLIQETIQTFFFFLRQSSILAVCTASNSKRAAEFNYKVYSLHFYQTPNYIRKKTLKESFLEFQTLDAIHNSSLSHDHVAHLKGIIRDYISLVIPREENLRAAKCCLTGSAKRESREEKG